MPKLNSKPLVSVVIPYYQHKQYIEDCIETIVAQTYDNIELIIIDDCSPDGSGEYVEKILKNKAWIDRFSKRIIFTYFKKNQGAHASINYGINKSKGKIITIVNSDDLYHPERLNIMIDAMQKEQKYFAFSGVLYINDNNQDVSKTDAWAMAYAEIQDKVKDFPTLGFACLLSNRGISTGNFVFFKSLYDHTLGFKSFRYCHDWDFMLQCLWYTEPLFVQEKLYYYRLHETNTFKSLQQLGVDDGPEVLLHYYDSVSRCKTLNSLAPSPFNWPGYFDLFLRRHGHEQFYKKSVYVNT
ncbi:glycosyltransferase [Planktothrix agardhii 1033]|nr:glycosyltransferase [Planktothrix agardhii 1033]